MKIRSISLVAALALSSGLYAESDMKVNGHVKLWYQTMDHGGVDDKGLFIYDPKYGNEWGDVGVQLKASGTMNDHISYGVALNGVTTMGMEGYLVGAETTRNNWRTSDGVNGSSAQPFWFHEVFINYDLDNTNFILGRQELNTPLAYTEKWNATSNAFEALLITNTDLPDTTLIAAWVSKGNGATNNLVYAPQVFGAETQFYDYMGYDQDIDGDGVSDIKTEGGALVAAAVNKSLPILPVQAWLYHIPQVASAFWVQGDLGLKDMGAVKKAGVQLIAAGVGVDGDVEDLLKSLDSKTDMSTAFAAKASASIGMFNAYAAFSTISEGNVPVANTATNYKKTKIPTASIFSDGMVAAQPDTTAFKVGAGAKFEGIGSLAVSYGSYNVGENPDHISPNWKIGGPASMGVIAHDRGEDIDLNEIDVVFKTKVKDVNLAAMYINVDKTYVPGGPAEDYGTQDNQIVRIVAQLNF